MKNETILFILVGVIAVLTAILFWREPLYLFFGFMVTLFFAGCGWCEKTNNF